MVLGVLINWEKAVKKCAKAASSENISVGEYFWEEYSDLQFTYTFKSILTASFFPELGQEVRDKMESLQKRACDPHYLLGSSGIKMQAKNDSQYHIDVSNIKNPHIYEKVVREAVVAGI